MATIMNRLIREKSPYLLQHAYNPVDWYPWGPEAFHRARQEDKPVFLSVGYAACHWCHVMAHESFESEPVAHLLNRYFVSIKVDREERPDVDDVYMTAVQLTTGRGGWPLSVFMTPDGEPFFAGTYFPPHVFPQVVQQLGEAYRTRRLEVLAAAREITEAIRQVTSLRAVELRGEPDLTVVSRYLQQMSAAFDREFGGFGHAPKFPPNTAFPLLLWLAEHLNNDVASVMAFRTLDQMALGGIHDHIGGGFHRYSTDERWLVPHFEKMLYDNAQLGWAYVEAYRLTTLEEYGLPGNPLYRKVAERLYQWVLREMLVEESAFAGALDADSEGEEGKYYTWTEEEIRQVLDAAEWEGGGVGERETKGQGDKETRGQGENPKPETRISDLFCQIYQIQPEGNYLEEATRERTGRNIPHLLMLLMEVDEETEMSEERLNEVRQTAQNAGISEERFHTAMQAVRESWRQACLMREAREQLLQARLKRVPPLRDDKVLTGWNGLMIGSLAHAAKGLQNETYLQAAIRAAEFIWTRLRTPDGQLLRRYREGEAAIPAYLEDYALLGEGLLSLYEASDDDRWLQAARELAEAMIKHFWDQEHGAFFTTGAQHEQLIAQVKEVYDQALPSGNGSAARLLARLARHTGEERYRRYAHETIAALWGLIETAPHGTESLLHALLLLQGEGLQELPLALGRVVAAHAEGPVQVSLHLTEGGLLVYFQIEEGWHINAPETGLPHLIPTSLEVSSTLPLQFGEVQWSVPESDQIGGEELQVYRDKAMAMIPLAVAGEVEHAEGEIRVRVRFQPCTETECAAPQEVELVQPVRLQTRER